MSSSFHFPPFSGSFFTCLLLISVLFCTQGADAGAIMLYSKTTKCGKGSQFGSMLIDITGNNGCADVRNVRSISTVAQLPPECTVRFYSDDHCRKVAHTINTSSGTCKCLSFPIPPRTMTWECDYAWGRTGNVAQEIDAGTDSQRQAQEEWTLSAGDISISSKSAMPLGNITELPTARDAETDASLVYSRHMRGISKRSADCSYKVDYFSNDWQIGGAVATHNGQTTGGTAFKVEGMWMGGEESRMVWSNMFPIAIDIAEFLFVTALTSTKKY